MATPIPREHRRRLVMLSSAVLLAGVVLVLLAGDWSGPGAEPAAAVPDAASVPGAPADARSATVLARPGPTPPVEPTARPALEPPAEEPTRQAFDGPPRPPIRCLEADTGRPLAGVRLYEKGAPIAGPSEGDGTLPLGVVEGDHLVLWVRGWLPVNVRADALPEEVAFQAATGAIELRFENGSFDHRVRRTLLQPHVPGRGSGMPWTATLEEQAPDLWTATGIAPGTYDLYAWVQYPDEEELRTFSARSLQVDGTQPARCSFDLAAPRSPDEQEADG